MAEPALCAAAAVAGLNKMDASAAKPAAGGEGEGDTPRLQLDDFSGTLAHLLSLARAHAIDLARLSLADCIQQVAAALEQNGPTLCLAQRADWLVMAAWLVLLWSRLLLPEASPTEGVGETSVLNRDGTGWDIGGAVRFLLSDQARYIAGHVLVVDGGVTLVGPSRAPQ